MQFATKRFAENGFHPTSVSDIVDGVGVGKGVFYWYFPSKDDLLLEILRDALYDLRRTQEDALAAASDPLERLELGIRASLAWSAANPDILRLAMFGWTEAHFARAMEKGRRIAISDIARHVGAAIDTGQIAPGDATMMATAIRGVTDELSRQYIHGQSELDDDVIAAAVRMCLYGVTGNGHRPTSTGE
ncbi:MAG: TetR/AcrR family transcriptional regulator [Acidimicrobiia bacterium]|nr:TetR/AcrR family transcriptional regulator [Acidimicrobiia bacterium]